MQSCVWSHVPDDHRFDNLDSLLSPALGTPGSFVALVQVCCVVFFFSVPWNCELFCSSSAAQGRALWLVTMQLWQDQLGLKAGRPEDKSVVALLIEGSVN